MQLSIPKVKRLDLPTKNRGKSSVIFAAIMYRILRSILFLFPPEGVHYFSMNILKLLCRIGFRKLISWLYKPKGNVQCSMLNIQFSNPVGLGAGFDKNALYLRELECLGFGFVEIGTVTPMPQKGNEKPRLFRLPKDKALVNRMGFNNDGVKTIAGRLSVWKTRQDSRLTTPAYAEASAGKPDSRLTTPDSELPTPDSPYSSSNSSSRSVSGSAPGSSPARLIP